MNHEYQPIDASYFDTAPNRFDTRIVVDHPIALVWQVFGDNAAWMQFTSAIKGAKWASPPPLGPGSTREVELGIMGWSATIDEVFFLWEPNTEFAFYMQQGNTDLIHGYGEAWSFRDLGVGKAEIRLRAAFELNGAVAESLAWLFSRVLEYGFRSDLEHVKS